MGIDLDINSFNAFDGESPAAYADRLGIHYTSVVDVDHKKENGQFFTPLEIAKFMTGFSSKESEKVKILDPGCGVGILSAALCEVLAHRNNVKSIELVAFETDIDILPLSDLCFNYLAKWLKSKNIEFTYFLCKNDFILHNSRVLGSDIVNRECYDFIISNPPYFKLPKNDNRILAAKNVIHGQTNIYSIFLLIAAKLLGQNGQLIFITPRSFCSGNYFRLFRELFFEIVLIQNVHLFNSRKDTFKRDKVLQENIIITAVPNLKANLTLDREISVSSSNGVIDINLRRSKRYKWNELVNINSYQKILHLPSSDVDEKVIKIFKTWTGSLKEYDLAISTGPVVDFRSTDFICHRKSKEAVPLLWLHNIENMNISWPKNQGYKGKPKGQYIKNNEKSFSRLVKNTNYVLLRRFSTKDDNKRLIAAPYLKNSISNQPFIGVENHLNYIYHKNDELSEKEIYGLAGILNSRLFDIYFRTFNGNINVSATELRDFPLPQMDKIRSLGEAIIRYKETNKMYDIDSLVSKEFNILFDLSKNYGY